MTSYMSVSEKEEIEWCFKDKVPRLGSVTKDKVMLPFIIVKLYKENS